MVHLECIPPVHLECTPPRALGVHPGGVKVGRLHGGVPTVNHVKTGMQFLATFPIKIFLSFIFFKKTIDSIFLCGNMKKDRLPNATHLKQKQTKTKTMNTKTKEIDWTKVNVHKKLTYLQNHLACSGIKKTGNVSLGAGKKGYDYIQLQDFTGELLKVADEIGLCFITNFEDTKATLTVVNADKPEDKISISCRNIPIPDFKDEVVTQRNYKGEEVTKNLSDETRFQKQIKLEGASQTYIRRYLMVAILNLAVPDDIEGSTPVTGSWISQSHNTYKQPTHKSDDGWTRTNNLVSYTPPTTASLPKPAAKTIAEEDVPYGDELISEYATAESKKKLMDLFKDLPSSIRKNDPLCRNIKNWMDGFYGKKMTQKECNSFIAALEDMHKGIKI